MQINKFRFFDKEYGMSGTFTLAQLVGLSCEIEMYVDKLGDDFWMQWTGIEDINGREVFEGDIFILNKDDDEWHDRVIWDAIECRFELTRYRNPVTDISLIECCRWDNCEVVGNIHENPELLKK